jgi:16S rRNA (cytidine1402-2'-O)-methyltransferase
VLLLAAAPLGNPLDASAHLKSAISSATFIAAEDSRKLSRLCSDLQISHSARVISFFEGNELERIDELVAIMDSGADLLVITDAGMPGISDPGYRLVRAAVARNIQVQVLPGPSAVTTALLLSGLPSDRFCFEGFPPRTRGARQSWFENLLEEERTLIFFEAPHRLLETLEDADQILGSDRPAAICREMTKTYEEIVRGPLSALLAWARTNEIRGEITMVVQGFDPESKQFTANDFVELVKTEELSGITRKEAIESVAKRLGVSKRSVFDAMVESKKTGQ